MLLAGYIYWSWWCKALKPAPSLSTFSSVRGGAPAGKKNYLLYFYSAPSLLIIGEFSKSAERISTKLSMRTGRWTVIENECLKLLKSVGVSGWDLGANMSLFGRALPH